MTAVIRLLFFCPTHWLAAVMRQLEHGAERAKPGSSPSRKGLAASGAKCIRNMPEAGCTVTSNLQVHYTHVNCEPGMSSCHIPQPKTCAPLPFCSAALQHLGKHR